MKRINLIMLLLLGLCLSACIGEKDKTPVVNPNPKNKIHLHGTFPFDKGFEVKMQAEYYATNPKCATDTGKAFGLFPTTGPQPYTQNLSLEIKQTGNSYEVDFYTDYFEAGKCGWTVFGVGSKIFYIQDLEYSKKISKSNFNDLLRFKDKENQVRSDIVCGFYPFKEYPNTTKKSFECTPEEFFTKNPQGYLPIYTKETQDITQNIIYQEKNLPIR